MDGFGWFFNSISLRGCRCEISGQRTPARPAVKFWTLKHLFWVERGSGRAGRVTLGDAKRPAQQYQPRRGRTTERMDSAGGAPRSKRHQAWRQPSGAITERGTRHYIKTWYYGKRLAYDIGWARFDAFCLVPLPLRSAWRRRVAPNLNQKVQNATLKNYSVGSFSTIGQKKLRIRLNEHVSYYSACISTVKLFAFFYIGCYIWPTSSTIKARIRVYERVSWHSVSISVELDYYDLLGHLSCRSLKVFRSILCD